MSEDRESRIQMEPGEIGEEVDLSKDGTADKDSGSQVTDFIIGYDDKISELKNEIKALKLLRKQQEKIEKLEKKKKEILNEMELKDENGKRRREKRRRRKRD